MESSNKQQLLDRYYEGAQLTPREQEEFKQYLKDPDFVEEIQFNEVLTKVIQEDHQQSPLKKQFQELEKKIRFRRRLVQIGIGIAAIGLIGFGIWNYYKSAAEEPNTPVSNPLIAMVEYQQEPQLIISRRGGNVSETTPLDACADKYVDELYAEAQTCFTQLAQQEPNNPAYQIFLGHTYFKEGNYDQAYETFDQLLESPTLTNEDDREQVQFNRVLSMFLAKKTGAASALDQLLEDQNNRYYPAAKGLKKLLEE